MPVRRRSKQRQGSAAAVLGMGYSSTPHFNNLSRSFSLRRRRHQHRSRQDKDTGSTAANNTKKSGREGHRKESESSRKKEVSVCLRSMSPSHQPTTMSRTLNDSQLPLRVVLPPEKMAENKSSRLLTLDQDCNKKLNDSETTDDNNKTINVEEFECGVSVAGSDKQEWSFTLYDFDGKGKITKEDLGSLLRSLYDAVGSSINLPKSGTKTLKLRLTVSPDNSKVAEGAGIVSGSTPRTKENRDKNDCRKETNNKTKESKLNKDLDNSKLSGKDLKLDNISKAEQLNLEAVATQETKVHHKEVKNNLSNPGKPAGKPKLSTVEQRHLAELVQKNMERHHQRQQQRHHQRARRHNSDLRKQHHSFNAGNNNRTVHTCEESRDRRNYYLDLAGIENDEPSKLHNTSAPADLLSPRIGKHRSRDTAKVRSRSHNSRQRHQQHQHVENATGETGCDAAMHQRSHSYDVQKEHCCPLRTGEELAAEVATHRTRVIERTVEEKIEKSKLVGGVTSPNPTNATISMVASPESRTSPMTTSTPNKNNGHHKLRPVSLPPNVPDTVSPHHHRRHRNRDRNRKLAMQQVAEWIEREHSWNTALGNFMGTAADAEDKVGANVDGATANAGNVGGGCGKAAVQNVESQHVIVQRHEHHHVHEHHHHHHYHHYHET